MVVAQYSKVVLDGVSSFDAHQRRELVVAMRGFDVGHAEGHHHLVRMFAGLLIDTIDELQCPVGILTGIERWLDPDGKEFGA